MSRKVILTVLFLISSYSFADISIPENLQNKVIILKAVVKNSSILESCNKFSELQETIELFKQGAQANRFMDAFITLCPQEFLEIMLLIERDHQIKALRTTGAWEAPVSQAKALEPYRNELKYKKLFNELLNKYIEPCLVENPHLNMACGNYNAL